MVNRYTPILVLIAWLGFAAESSAQQAPQYSLYMLNPYSLNPAFAGLENTLVMNAVYRKQWTNLKGAPETQHVNASMPVYVLRGGVGLKLENDGIGAHRSTQAMLSYNYQIEWGRNTLLALGVGAGYLQYALDGTKLRAPDGEYAVPSGVFQHNDVLLPEGKLQAGSPVFEAGIFLQAGSWEAGLSSQPAFASAIEASGTGFRLQPVQHYFFYGGYTFRIGRENSLKPTVLVKNDAVETQIEISTVFRWRNNIFAGASYRGLGNASRDAAVILAGMKLNEKTTLAYSFDAPMSPLRAVNRGSHELLLRYSLDKPLGSGKLPPVIYNPRFF